jgi:hypothetical protein
MPVKWPLPAKAGIGVIALGIAPYLYALGLIYSHDWEPLRAPVSLVPGNFQSPEFKTDRNGRYLVNLAFDQKQDFPDFWEQCMIGETSLNQCYGITQTLEFNWRIVSNGGQVLQNGSYQLLGSGGVDGGIGTTFAIFQGKRRARQHVVLEIKRDAGKLNTVHPRVVVEPGGEYFEGIPELVGYSLFWAKTVGSLGLICVVVPLGVELLGRRKSMPHDSGS